MLEFQKEFLFLVEGFVVLKVEKLVLKMVRNIGGNYASSLNLNSTIPNIFFENDNIDVNFFVDLANVWEVDYNSAIDSNKLRSARYCHKLV